MIPVDNPIPEPEDFEQKCRQAGKKWLLANQNETRPKDFWSPFRLKLAAGFLDRCGYGAMYIPSGQVDHHASIDEDRSQSYEWSNFRYIDGWINSAKSKRKVIELLDPFEVQEGWFELELPSLQLKTTDAMPAEYRKRAANTLCFLHLGHDERIVRQRRAWLEMYEQGTPLEVIRQRAPLIAAAIEKRNRLDGSSGGNNNYNEGSIQIEVNPRRDFIETHALRAGNIDV